MKWIDYRQLSPSVGGLSRLFCDYIYNFNAVRRFYKYDFRDFQSYESVIHTITQHDVTRAVLTKALIAQNRTFGSPPKTFENIGLLERKSTYAVVTGQQVGLFGGPLYTVFKTITAIKLAETLKKKFLQYDFVPVFWVEGEDHDFAEMNNVAMLDAENKVVKIEYLPGGAMPERNLGPIGELVFDGAIEQSYAALDSSLQSTEFTADMVKSLKHCYAAGRTFNQAFVSWMNLLFEDHGVIFISSNDPELKRILSPVFVKEVSEFPAASQLVIGQSAELEHEYHAQVKAKSLNLFLFHKGGRYLVEPREHDFSLKGTRHFLQRDELLQIAMERPEQLSPNVILRPIAQDTLLPTVAYVGGPSEVAYNAQLSPVYEYFGVVQPVIYPRASGSIVAERTERTMEKYQVEFARIFENPDAVVARVLEQVADVKLDQVFEEAKIKIHQALHEMKFGLVEVDATLQGALKTFQSKIDTHMEVLREKSLSAQKRRNETVVRQIQRAASGLLPNGNLQERELSLLYFMNKYGPDIVHWLMDELDITGFKHQLISA